MSKEILVLKIGSSTLTQRTADGREALDLASFARIGAQICQLKTDGYNIVLVSSAAITGGMAASGYTKRPSRVHEMPELQRLASIGWRHVLNAWADALPGHTIGELLLTRAELDISHERREVVVVLNTLLRHGNIPIINENDAVSHEQIAYGDNDTLAAVVAASLAAETAAKLPVRLILLSDVEGVYADVTQPSSRLPRIHDLELVAHMAGVADSHCGTGGMASKFTAAGIASQAGVETWVAHGRHNNVIAQTLAGRTGTHFALQTHVGV